MKRNVQLGVVVVSILACGCGEAITQANLPDSLMSRLSESLQSGVVGKVLLGPTTPVQRSDDEDGGYVPYAAAIEVHASGGGMITRVEAAEDGVFAVELDPGNYMLVPQSGEAPAGAFEVERYPRAEPVQVTVPESDVVQVTIVFDTGIR